MAVDDQLRSKPVRVAIYMVLQTVSPETPVEIKSWCIYLLYHPKANRTYIGITNNPKRRLRQHNCEIKGGAKYTSRIVSRFGAYWKFICHLHLLETDKSTIMRWEKLLKLSSNGKVGRLQAFLDISSGLYPKSFTLKQKAKHQLPRVSGIDIYE